MREFEEISEKVASFFENGGMCNDEEFGISRLAEAIGVEQEELEKFFKEESDYSLEEMRDIYSGKYQCLRIPDCPGRK